MYTILATIAAVFHVSIASSGTASTPGRRSTGIPPSFPFFLLLFFFFTLLLFHNHCMMVGSNVSITVEPTIAKQGRFPLSQFIPRLKLFVEIPWSPTKKRPTQGCNYAQCGKTDTQHKFKKRLSGELTGRTLVRAITHTNSALAYAGGVVAGGVGGARHGLTVGVGSGGLYILCSVGADL